MPPTRRARSQSAPRKSKSSFPTITESDGITTCVCPPPSTHKLRRSTSAISRSLTTPFLPNPASLDSPSQYYEYQIYDTLQGLSSYLRSLLTTASVLSTMGIGDAVATPIAAALIWAFRDGLGMIVGLLFSGTNSHAFKGYVLQYRLFADVINDVGMLVDITLPFFDSKFYNLGYAISTSCKAICGVAAGATRGSILMSFTDGRDTSEITSKESAQETAITVIGIMCGVVVGGWVEEWRFLWFGFWTFVHVYANYKAVKSVKFKQLNFPRLKTLILNDKIVNPTEMDEPVFGFWDMLRGSNIDLGCSLAEIGMSTVDIQEVKSKKYMLKKINGRTKVAISASATSSDILDAATEALEGTKPTTDWAKQLANAGWKIDEFHFFVGDWRYKVSE